MRALLIVDMQPTFCEGGEVPVAGGNDLAHRVAEYLRTNASRYQLIVTTQDWHIDPGDHFSTDPDFVDTWPPHGVAGSANAEIHPVVADSLPAGVLSVKKGQYEAAYSGFEGVTEDGTMLADALRAHHISEVEVVGLAFSHCVCATALDAEEEGFQATVLQDLAKSVSPETELTALKKLAAAGIPVTASSFLT